MKGKPARSHFHLKTRQNDWDYESSSEVAVNFPHQKPM